jgi:hypothetical protein
MDREPRLIFLLTILGELLPGSERSHTGKSDIKKSGGFERGNEISFGAVSSYDLGLVEMRLDGLDFESAVALGDGERSKDYGGESAKAKHGWISDSSVCRSFHLIQFSRIYMRSVVDAPS